VFVFSDFFFLFYFLFCLFEHQLEVHKEKTKQNKSCERICF